MFSPKLKLFISIEVQKILRRIPHGALPLEGEINFILHVDGAEDWAWANIRNESARDIPVPDVLIQNLSVSKE